MEQDEREIRDALIMGLVALYGRTATSPAIAHAVSLVTGEAVAASSVRIVLMRNHVPLRAKGRPQGSRNGARARKRRSEPLIEKPTLREQHEDLKERHEPLLRATVRLLAAYDPTDPEEAANLVAELGRAAGLSSQYEAQSILRQWGQPIHTGGGERLRQVVSSGGVRIR